MFMDSESFYYSLTYDLTNSVQRQSAGEDPRPLWQKVHLTAQSRVCLQSNLWPCLASVGKLKQHVSDLFVFCSASGDPITYMLNCLILPHMALKLCALSFFPPIFFPQKISIHHPHSVVNFIHLGSSVCFHYSAKSTHLQPLFLFILEHSSELL